MVQLVALETRAPQFEDLATLQGKAYTLRDLAAKAQATEQATADDKAARSAFSANPTDGTARLSALAAVSPKAYADESKRQSELAKSGAETRAKQVETASNSMDLAGKAFGYVRQYPTVENANAAIDWLQQQGVYTPEHAAQDKAKVAADPNNVAQLADIAFRAALDAKDQLSKFSTHDTGGNVQTIGTDPVTGKTTTLSTLAKSQSPDNVATNTRMAAEGAADRAARAAEGGANRANQIAVQKMIGERQDSRGSAEASLDGETLDLMADQALRGDRSVFQNIGRGAQGSANLVALRSRITQKAKAQGLTGADIASITADYGGQQAGLRTSGTISARIENAAAEAAQLAPLALAASDKVARSGFLPFGRAQVMFNNNTNDPSMNEFATANIGLATAYAGAMARGGKATVSDNEHARELLSTAKSQEAYKAIVNQMLQEIKAAQRAPQVVREHLRGQISNKGGSDHGAPAAAAPVVPPGWSVQEVK